MGDMGSATGGSVGFGALLVHQGLIALLVLAGLGALVYLTPNARLRRFIASERYAGLDRATTRARTALRLAVGGLWVLDGLLQAQPAMPSSFPSAVLQPLAGGGPHWLTNTINWEIYLWQSHPLPFAAATVAVQVGIGLAILAGGDGLLGRIGLYASIGWGLWVWVFGEALGGVLAGGASQLMGAPGAVLVYIGMAVALLLPARRVAAGALTRLLRRGVGVLLLTGAALQAWPSSGFASGTALSDMFTSMAGISQPSFVRAPVREMARLTASSPALWNSIAIAAMLLIGLSLLWRKSAGVGSITAIIWSATTWWVGQDFGVFGGTGTDPNMSLPVILVLVAAQIGSATSTPIAAVDDEPARDAAPTLSDLPAAPEADEVSGLPRWKVPVAALAVGLAVLGALPALVTVPSAAADAAIAPAVASGGPLQLLPGGVAQPSTVLTDQYGHPVRLNQFTGKVVVISFLDPVCYNACDIIGRQIVRASQLLGADNAHVQFVGINTNPKYPTVADVHAFGAQQGLNALPNWTYLTGTPAQLSAVLNRYGVLVIVPRLDMVMHPTVLLFIDRHGDQAAQANDSAMVESSVTDAYAQLIAREVRSLIG